MTSLQIIGYQRESAKIASYYADLEYYSSYNIKTAGLISGAWKTLGTIGSGLYHGIGAGAKGLTKGFSAGYTSAGAREGAHLGSQLWGGMRRGVISGAKGAWRKSGIGPSNFGRGLRKTFGNIGKLNKEYSAFTKGLGEGATPEISRFSHIRQGLKRQAPTTPGTVEAVANQGAKVENAIGKSTGGTMPKQTAGTTPPSTTVKQTAPGGAFKSTANLAQLSKDEAGALTGGAIAGMGVAATAPVAYMAMS